VKSSPLLQEKDKTRNVIIIKPKDESINCKQTENIAKNIIISQQCKVGVKRVKNISKGGIAIECSTPEECDSAINTISSNSTELTATKPVFKAPKIVIYGITDDLTENDIITEIITKNEEIKTFTQNLSDEELKHNITIKFKLRQKSKSTVNHWVFEVSPEIRKIIIKAKSVLIGWKSCPVADYIYVLRCLKCNGFGHKGYDSENTCKGNVCCGHCGQTHETKNCKQTAQNAFCVNCDKYNKKNGKNIFPTNHSSFNANCNCLKRIQNIIKSKTNYGQ
jgi:hypothetical protein